MADVEAFRSARKFTQPGRAKCGAIFFDLGRHLSRRSALTGPREAVG